MFSSYKKHFHKKKGLKIFRIINVKQPPDDNKHCHIFLSMYDTISIIHAIQKVPRYHIAYFVTPHTHFLLVINYQYLKTHLVVHLR